MAEYIDREEAKAKIREKFKFVPARIEINEVLNSIPAADVRPVVLCRDCEQYCGRPWENNETGICARTDFGAGEDDFCSYGEKQEES